LLSYSDKCRNRSIDLLATERRAHLRAHPSLPFGHHREGKGGDKNALFHEAAGKLLREFCVAGHDRHDRMLTIDDIETGDNHVFAKIGCIRCKLAPQIGALLDQFERGQGRADNAWGETVGKQVRPGTLAQQVDKRLRTGNVTAAGAAECLAEGAGSDLHPALDTL